MPPRFSAPSRFCAAGRRTTRCSLATPASARRRSLDADAEGLLADGERLAHAASLPLDHDALEDLGPGAGALDHLEVDANAVAGGEPRAALQLLLLEALDDRAHGRLIGGRRPGVDGRRRSRKDRIRPRGRRIVAKPTSALDRRPARGCAPGATRGPARGRPRRAPRGCPSRDRRAGGCSAGTRGRPRARSRRTPRARCRRGRARPGSLRRTASATTIAASSPAGEHVAADRDRVRDQVLANPLVDALVAAADQRQLGLRGELGASSSSNIRPDGVSSTIRAAAPRIAVGGLRARRRPRPPASPSRRRRRRASRRPARRRAASSRAGRETGAPSRRRPRCARGAGSRTTRTSSGRG